MTTELQWRRTWRPDLRSCPWKPIEIGGNIYLIKTHFLADSYELLLTDCSRMWMEHLQEVALRKQIKKLNPSLEAHTQKVLDHIQGNFDDFKDNTSFSISFNEDVNEMTLTVQSKLAGMPFLWQVNGRMVDRQMLSEHLTLPLLTMVGELFRRQNKLLKIINSKDKEIEDYKAQGAKCSRKHYETRMFDDTAFRHDMTTSKDFEEQVKSLGVGAFVDGGQNMYREIMTKHAWLNRPPSAEEGSDSLSDDPSLEQVLPSSGTTSWGNRIPPSLVPTSPRKSPNSSPAGSPTKDTELMRRQALEKRILDEEAKKQSKAKKKKKIAF